MSTIAYKNGIMAADSAMSQDDEVQLGIYKLAKTKEYLVGFTGTMAMKAPVLDWIFELENCLVPIDKFYRHKDLLPTMHGSLMCLVATRAGSLWYLYGDGMVCETARKFDAAGSGMPYAIGALYAGASAEEAVNIACNLDAFSGGDIKTISFDT